MEYSSSNSNSSGDNVIVMIPSASDYSRQDIDSSDNENDNTSNYDNDNDIEFSDDIDPIHSGSTIDFEESETATSPILSRLSNNDRDIDVQDDDDDEEESDEQDDEGYTGENVTTTGASIFEIPKLGGMTEQIFNINIYPYLSPKDLCYLGACSKYFLRSTSTAKVWIRLTQQDFLDFRITIPRRHYQSDINSQHHLREYALLQDNDTASRGSRVSASSGSNAAISATARSNYSSAVSASNHFSNTIRDPMYFTTNTANTVNSTRTLYHNNTQQQQQQQPIIGMNGPISNQPNNNFNESNHTAINMRTSTHLNSTTTTPFTNTGTGFTTGIGMNITRGERSVSNSSTPVRRYNPYSTSASLTNNVLASLRERGSNRHPITNSIREEESESNVPIEFNDGVHNVYNKYAAKSLYIKKYIEMKRLSNQRESYDDMYWKN